MLETNYYALTIGGRSTANKEFWESGNYFDENEKCFHFNNKTIFCKNLRRSFHSVRFESDEVITLEDIKLLLNSLPDAQELFIRLYFCCPQNGTYGIWAIKRGMIEYKIEGYLDTFFNDLTDECLESLEQEEDILHSLLGTLLSEISMIEPPKEITGYCSHAVLPDMQQG